MKRIAYTFLVIGLLLGFCAASNAQNSCYSQAYQSAAEPFSLSAATQTYTVSVPVTVTVAAQPVAVAAPVPLAVAAPQSSCGAVGYAAPLAAPFAVAAPSYGASCGVGFNAGFSYGHNVGFGLNRGIVNHNFGFNRFGSVGGVGGIGGIGGVNITARDRRGTVVNASGVNNVKIDRGIFGNIRGARADSNRGLFGRISPF